MRLSVQTADGRPREIRLSDVQGEPAPLVTLAQAAYLSGFFQAPALCSGLGRCGRCRVRFLPASSTIPDPLEADLDILGRDAVANGWRLGCRHRAVDGMALELALEVGVFAEEGRPTFPASPHTSGPHASETCALAVDFGSTSLHYAFVASGANTAAAGSRTAVNPQMGAGGDIMSRLAWAEPAQGRERLRELSLAALRRMLAEANCGRVEEVVLAANSAMVYLLLGKDAAGLRSAPYRLDYAGGALESLAGLPSLWVCPLISPFVGGDVSAGYAALLHSPAHSGISVPAYPFLLADLGTNGEFLLVLDENTALAASLPLGPALEGIGMRWGAEVRSGPEALPVITGFTVGPAGPEPVLSVPGGQTGGQAGSQAVGISATGYLSLLHQLRKLGLLDESGHFSRPEAAPNLLARKLLPRIRPLPHGEPAWFVTPELYVSAGDIEELLKVKASFSLAFKILLERAGKRPADLAGVYLAGSLGRHVDIEALNGLGFLPSSLRRWIFPVGNTALAGAELLARRPDLREGLCRWAAGVETVSLAEDPGFQDCFAREMTFG